MSMSIYYPELDTDEVISDLLRLVMQNTDNIIKLYLCEEKDADFSYDDVHGSLINPEPSATWNEEHAIYEAKQRVNFYQYSDGYGDKKDRANLKDWAERYFTKQRFSILKKYVFREMKTYQIIIGGKIVGTYESDRGYSEFDKPFFEKFPQYKNILHYFNHVECYIAEKDLTTRPKYSVNKKGKLIKHFYIPLSFGVKKG